MSVTFSETPIIINYILNNKEKKDKKQAYKQALKSKTIKSRMIRSILYKAFPTEKKYIERKNKEENGGFNQIIGYCGKMKYNLITIYSSNQEKIEYNIYLNDYGKIVGEINTKGFGMVCHYIEFYDCGNFPEDIYKAEYKAKLFVLETTRRLLNKKNIT